MKTAPFQTGIRLTLALAVMGWIAAAPPAAIAADPGKPAPARLSTDSPRQATPAASARPRKVNAPQSEVVITGSLIPQDVKPSRAPAASSVPLVVIDRKAIRMSGASTVSEVLARTVPSVR